MVARRGVDIGIERVVERGREVRDHDLNVLGPGRRRLQPQLSEEIHLIQEELVLYSSMILYAYTHAFQKVYAILAYLN